EEEAILRPLKGLHQSQVIVQFGVRGPRGESKVDRPSLRVESPRSGDPLQQGGLAATVFTDDERDVGMELVVVKLANDRDTEWIRVIVGDALSLKRDRAEVRPRSHSHSL